MKIICDCGHTVHETVVEEKGIGLYMYVEPYDDLPEEVDKAYVFFSECEKCGRRPIVVEQKGKKP